MVFGSIVRVLVEHKNSIDRTDFVQVVRPESDTTDTKKNLCNRVNRDEDNDILIDEMILDDAVKLII